MTILVMNIFRSSPGGGHSAFRYGLVALAGVGIGLQDAVLVTFLLETLLRYGAQRFVAFLPLAIGGLISIVSTPTVNLFASRGVRKRQCFAYTLLFIGTASNIALAFVLRAPDGNVLRGIILATAYRVCVQSANFVPVLHDAAKVRGDGENLVKRRAIATAWYYITYRIGFISSSAVIAARPGKELEDLFLHLLCSSCVAIFFILVSAISAPDWDADNRPKPATKEQRKNESKLRDYLDIALFKADRRLHAMYIETCFHGIAFGLVGAVAASFFNDRVFQASAGFPKGVKWSAYSALTGLAFSLIVDALLPLITFALPVMTLFWVGGAILSGAIFAVLRGVTLKITAMILFGATSVTRSTHNLFSLLVAAAYVEPKFRGTSFSIRAASGSIGTTIGAVAGGLAAQYGGFDDVMLLCAVATGLSAVAAIFGGNVKEAAVDGAAVNANALLSHIFVAKRQPNNRA